MAHLTFFATHPKTKSAAVATGAVLAVIVIALSLFDWNWLRPALARRIAAVTGRPTAIDGDLALHLWSWEPTFEVNGLRIDNPTWADRQPMFSAQRLTVSVSLAQLLRGRIVLPEILMEKPVINLERASTTRASWAASPTGPSEGSKAPKIPAIRHLIIRGGDLHVVDKVRHLTFSGSLVASDQAGKQDGSAFKIRCSGTLNAKPFRLAADGGPLVDLEPDKPYRFTGRLTAADITLDSAVTVRKPFDFGALDVAFVVAGNDLADFYYLTGLALPNTPHYRLAATLHLDGTRVAFDDLQGHLGASDLSGRGTIETRGVRPLLTAQLTSAKLDMADLEPTLGQPIQRPDSLAATRGAASGTGADTAPAAAYADRLLLPDADLQVNRVRGMDADVTYRAAAVSMPKVPLKEVNFHLRLDAGLLTLDPLSFALDPGKFSGRVQIDARSNTPASDIDMRMDQVDLAQFKSATMKQAPLQGTLFGHFQLHGTGTSVHKFAADSNGAVSIVIPHGEISNVLAELTGINVAKGLGLLLSKSGEQTEIRCGIVDFKDRRGTLATTTVYVDTSNVLITGRGDIDLSSEDLHLALQGDPKKLRLVRLRSPISLHGTLLHPAVGIQADKLAEQAGVATALGVLLTPVAAALAFIDPGLAKDKDCSTVLSQANEGVRGNPANAAGVGDISPPIAGGAGPPDASPFANIHP